MIYIGYPCVGKSSICGSYNNAIDLESSNFIVDGKRDASWVQAYINIAIDLNKQGFDVFLSSHSAVIAELKARNLVFVGIFPTLSLKEQWIARAAKRYEATPSDKNKKALDRIITHFEVDVKSLKVSCLEGKTIEVTSCDYDLNSYV